MEQRSTKSYFQFNRGLNTEGNELTLAEGFSTDEQNYELLVDGSRRRRKGLTVEDGGATATVATHATTANTSDYYVWRKAGGDPDSNFIVHRLGQYIYFMPDTDGGSANWDSFSIHLEAWNIDYQTYTDASSAGIVDFTDGRGILFISFEHMKPLAVEYDPSDGTFTVTPIDIWIRDYDGIDDGYALDYRPPTGQAAAGTIDDLVADEPDHRYNLQCRGWNDTDIVQFGNDTDSELGTAVYPAKNEYWAMAYRRQTDVNYSDLDGIQLYDTTKIINEAFGGTDAPKGSILLSIFDDTEGFKEVSPSGDTTFVDYAGGTIGGTSDLDITDAGSTWTCTVTETGHSRNTNDIVSWRIVPRVTVVEVGEGTYLIDLVSTSSVTITATTVNTWSFSIPEPGYAIGDITQVLAFSAYGFTPLARSSGTGPTKWGPSAIEFHGGRLFYTGMGDSTWSDYLFYSQVITTSRNWGRCMTEADPTSPNFNAPQATDGGYLILPAMGKVRKMVSYNNSLVIFADQGVWEVTGRGTFFDPANYRVRKVSSAECDSTMGVCRVEDRLVYTGPKGVFMIQPNQYTGFLEAVDISSDRILTLWNALDNNERPFVVTCYDDAKKRLIVAVTDPDENYDVSIYGRGRRNLWYILDFRVGAWFKYTFNSAANSNVLHPFVITDGDNQSQNRKLKALVQDDVATQVEVCDFDSTGFDDWDTNQQPAYVLSAHEYIGDAAVRKQAPVVTVYAKRTETGYTETGNGYDPVNESSNLMTAYWDWSDDSVTGKIGTQVETYRHVRGFVPSGASDVDGYPVVVTRNKVRGRGRALQIRFDSATDKDSHILGYQVDYKKTRKR